MTTFNYKYVKPKFRNKIKLYSEKNCLVDKSMKAICYRNALVLPYKENQRGAVISEDLIEVSTDFPKKVNLSKYDTTNIVKGQKAILLGSFWIYVWGHCFTDHFSKLWFAFTEKCKKLQEEGAELIILSCKPQIPQYFKTLIELTGINWESIKIITIPTQYEELYVPDNCYFQQSGEWNRFYTKEYVALLERMKANIRKQADEAGDFPQYDKIYLTRTQGSFGTFRDLGEKIVENVFNKEGYTIVAPEKLTVPQQLWLMMNVKDLVSTDGSICHSSIFCSSGTKVTVLMKADFITENQIVAGQICNLQINYVSIHHSFFVDKKAPWHGPFLLGITSNLEKYLGHKILHIPFFCRIDFLLYCLRELYMKTIHHSFFINSLIKKLINIKHSY